MKRTVHEGNLFLLVESSLTAHFFTSLLANLKTPGVAKACNRRVTRAGLTAPPGGDHEDQGEESRSASDGQSRQETGVATYPAQQTRVTGSRACWASPGPTHPDDSASSGGYPDFSWAPWLRYLEH